ncbi:DUF262 domain-containing protein [uncultured Sphingomonas sp.]|uniref:DUF262 domain-containing protein n=1 Tax=uncultured Sphingomonas sp. TaxID=158754 RepID=UPI0035C98CB5
MLKLEAQIAKARKRVHRDGYDMSFGELASMYERSELIINPEYQRLFRWTEDKKTAFVESLLLGIPIPPIFIFTRADSTWELIDGLQRVSTILQLMGILQALDGQVGPRFTLGTSDLLPDLEGRFWPQPGEGNNPKALDQSQQIAVRRSRIRVEILDQQTDPEVKFELFQRLNTGGTNLSEQEVRNCIIASLSSDIYSLLLEMAEYLPFVEITDIGDQREKRQYRLELLIRFLVLRNFEYTTDVDVHRYLDRGIISLLQEKEFDWKAERKNFEKTMSALFQAVGVDAFRSNKRFSLGKYEFAVLGLSRALDEDSSISLQWIKQKVEGITSLPEFKKYSGAGVRGTQRLAKLVMPLSTPYFAD